MDDLRTDLVSINSVYGHIISGFSYKRVCIPSISLASDLGVTKDYIAGIGVGP